MIYYLVYDDCDDFFIYNDLYKLKNDIINSYQENMPETEITVQLVKAHSDGLLEFVVRADGKYQISYYAEPKIVNSGIDGNK